PSARSAARTRPTSDLGDIGLANCHYAQAADDVPGEGLRGGWRPDELLREPRRSLAARLHLCGHDPQGCEAWRVADGAAHEAELVISLRTVKAIGLTIPQMLGGILRVMLTSEGAPGPHETSKTRATGDAALKFESGGQCQRPCVCIRS